MQYLLKETFSTPTWMFESEVLDRIDGADIVENIRRAQVRALNQLLDEGRIARLIAAEAKLGSATYTPIEMMRDLRNGLWSELKRGQKIDTYRRNLQRAYIERMQHFMTEEQGSSRGNTSVDVSQSDIRPLVRAELKALRSQVRAGVGRTSDSMSKYHLEDAIERIDLILEPN